MPVMVVRVAAAWLVAAMATELTLACFIRNCPRGGKRSMEVRPTAKQCMPCGPAGVGQCVGPATCCGRDFGCLMGTPETEVCQAENESTVPCSIRGAKCGQDDGGHCVADGICCDEGACSFNAACKAEAGETPGELVNLIRRLLVNRRID